MDVKSLASDKVAYVPVHSYGKKEIMYSYVLNYLLFRITQLHMGQGTNPHNLHASNFFFEKMPIYCNESSKMKCTGTSNYTYAFIDRHWKAAKSIALGGIL